MRFVSRAEWGARAARNGHPVVGTNQGVKIHYLGGPYHADEHSTCAGYMRKVQNSHMDGNGWSDFAYNLAVCEHGHVFEGRGRNAQNAANGNTTLNRNHFAVLAFVGDSGHTGPTAEQVAGLRDAIGYLRANGAGREIRGHRDGYATECPGPALYELVRSGALEPGAGSGGPGPGPDGSGLAPFPGTAWFRSAPRSPLVTAMGRRLVEEGCGAYREGPGPQWSEADRQSYARWQRKLGYSGTDADGWPGASSWSRLRVPRA